MSNEAEDIHRRWSGREDGVVSEDRRCSKRKKSKRWWLTMCV